MPAPKFNFVPEAQIKNMPHAETVFKVTVNKVGQLTFSREYTSVYDLDNKFIRIYADAEKKTLGWQIIDQSQTLEELDGLRLLKKNSTGNIQVSIGRLLAAIDIKIDKTLSKLRVKTYTSLMHAGDIHYVELVKEVAEIK